MRTYTTTELNRLKLLKKKALDIVQSSEESETRKQVLTDMLEESYDIAEIRAIIDENEIDKGLVAIRHELGERLTQVYGEDSEIVAMITGKSDVSIEDSIIEIEDGSEMELLQRLCDGESVEELDEAIVEDIENGNDLIYVEDDTDELLAELENDDEMLYNEDDTYCEAEDEACDIDLSDYDTDYIDDNISNLDDELLDDELDNEVHMNEDSELIGNLEDDSEDLLSELEDDYLDDLASELFNEGDNSDQIEQAVEEENELYEEDELYESNNDDSDEIGDDALLDDAELLADLVENSELDETDEALYEDEADLLSEYDDDIYYENSNEIDLSEYEIDNQDELLDIDADDELIDEDDSLEDTALFEDLLEEEDNIEIEEETSGSVDDLFVDVFDEDEYAEDSAALEDELDDSLSIDDDDILLEDELLEDEKEDLYSSFGKTQDLYSSSSMKSNVPTPIINGGNGQNISRTKSQLFTDNRANSVLDTVANIDIKKAAKSIAGLFKKGAKK